MVLIGLYLASRNTVRIDSIAGKANKGTDGTAGN